MEDNGFEKKVTEEGVSSIIGKCRDVLPGLEKLKIKEKWCGLRPFAEDKLPIIGKENVENLILATGHGRNGILLAPITAKAVEELIVYDKAIPEIKDFDSLHEGTQASAEFYCSQVPSKFTPEELVLKTHIIKSKSESGHCGPSCGCNH